MSSFSSVVQKPGKKIVPKVAPRRNVPRKNTAITASTNLASSDTDAHTGHNNVQDVPNPLVDQLENSIEPVAQETQRSIPEIVNSSPSHADIAVQDRPADVPSRESAIPLIQLSARESQRPVRSDSQNARISALDDEHRTSADVSTNAFAIDTVSEQQRVIVVADANLRPNLPESNKEATGMPRLARSRVQRLSHDNIDVPSNPRKRRKVTPTERPADVLIQNPRTSQSVELIQPLPTVHVQRNQPGQDTQPAEDLLASATRRAASVSELANTIESQTRSLRPQIVNGAATEDALEVNTNGKTPSPSHSKPRRQQKPIAEQAAEVVANAMGKPAGVLRPRAGTPEDAESYELEPAKVTMGQLCEDRKLGKKSILESEMQANWPEILQRRKEDRERALLNAENRRRKGVGSKFQLPDPAEAVVALAPAMAVVNGVIVVDQASREIDRGAQLQQAAMQDLDHVREDRNYYKYVNSGTVGIKPGHGQHAKWDEESTERFFRGLRMFGTDFLMIANTFPGMSRRQIKTKFIREENADKSRVLECLRNREPIQLEDYAQMTNKDTDDFHTLESIQKELDAQEKRLREEDNQRRKREGFVAADESEDQTQPAEQDHNEGNGRQSEPNEPGRFDAVASEIVEAAVAPKKKQQRKTNTTTQKRGPKSSRRPEGGIEEILGNIDEVAV